MTTNMKSPPAPKTYPKVFDSLTQVLTAMWDKGVLNSRTCPDIGSLISSGVCSCGVSILSGLSASSPESIVNKVLKERADTDPKTIREAFVVFSDVQESYGDRLCTYIREHNLGNIGEFGPRLNPNSGNMIKIWVWEPPHESLESKYRYMPIYGKKLVADAYGHLTIYQDDPRFLSRGTEA